MTSSPRSRSWGTVLTELGPSARLLTPATGQLNLPVSGPRIWVGVLPEDPDAVLICPIVDEDGRELAALLHQLPDDPPRLVVLTGECHIPPGELSQVAGRNAIVEVADADPADIVIALAGTALSPEESVTRRLSSLQRRLTQVLGDPNPIAALADRLKSLCNATVTLIDRHGAAIQSTGPVPFSLLFNEISRTTADSQVIDVEGWHGVADRVGDPTQGGDHVGWLVVVARRPSFPDLYTTAAVHVASTLVEASFQITTVSQQQERAIRAAVLEEALALQRQPHNPGLAGRISSLGLSFDQELRIVVLRAQGPKPAPASPAEGGWPDRLARIMKTAGITFLMSVQDKATTVLAQCSPATLRRLLVAQSAQLPKFQVGVGRAVATLGAVPDSYHDAQLALQTLNRRGRGPWLMTYDEFDLATRLFAEVGLERMGAWARQFLAPIQDREALAEGLRAYFDHDLNIIATAEALGIHHNSLRYRLAKVEELLAINLHVPSAVSSVYLALAAVDLDQMRSQPPKSATAPTSRPFDVEAPATTGYVAPGRDALGVVRAPDH